MTSTLKKILQANKKDWDQKLDRTLWGFWMSYKVSIGMTPFWMAYGLESMVNMEFLVPSLRIAIKKKLPMEESLADQI